MKNKKPRPDSQLRLSARLRATSKGDRTFDVVASTDTLNSHGYIVEQDWVLDRYADNPVVLWNHNLSGGMFSEPEPEHALPIGFAKDVRVEDGALLATVQLVSEEANPLAEKIFRLMSEGALNAVSVGFWPGDVRYEKRDGREVEVLSKNELYEISVVPVPADPRAIAQNNARALSAFAEHSKKGSSGMDPKILAALLGLSDGAGESQIMTAARNLAADRDRLLAATGKTSVPEAIGAIEGLRASSDRCDQLSAELTRRNTSDREREAKRVIEEDGKEKVAPKSRASLLSRVKTDEDLEWLRGHVAELPKLVEIEQSRPAPSPGATAAGAGKQLSGMAKAWGLSAEDMERANRRNSGSLEMTSEEGTEG
jgi:HK97 family phage prohead protease